MNRLVVSARKADQSLEIPVINKKYIFYFAAITESLLGPKSKKAFLYNVNVLRKSVPQFIKEFQIFKKELMVKELRFNKPVVVCDIFNV